MSYQPQSVEAKWQEKWFSGDAFKAVVDKSKEPYYVLEMLPYPSGQLHMGHVRNYTLGDVLARTKRAQGFNVLHPMGWDAFGLPAENAALKRNIHPEKWTLENIQQMKTTMKQFGWSYDWSREVASCLPSYYKHQQALFIDMLNKGIAYRKESVVNWDPVENTVLANEQVVDGKGWRSGVAVERRTMHQWHLKITAYAQELLDDLEQLEGWPERVRHMQRNWIGRSEGLKFTFDLKDSAEKLEAKKLEVYTTRPDTLFGCTFCAVAAEHPLAKNCAETNPAAAEFIAECSKLGTSEEAIERAEKKGYDTGLRAIHPFTGGEVPVFIANFVLMGYGTGAIMAVPAHDERDHAFATKYNLPIVPVVEVEGEEGFHNKYGTLVNSGDFTGMESEAAKTKMIDWFEAKNTGERMVNWRLRDWGMSRQRYWGCPIPVIHCESCGVVAEKKENLPVKLPEDVSFDKPGNPLNHHPTWKHTTCPCCGKKAVRETDTMDTFMDSSWYFLRYMCPTLEDAPLKRQEVDYWWQGKTGTNQYIGGIEHAVLHLLYARFFTKVLRDLGYVSAAEPFNALLCQGMLIGNAYQKADGSYLYPSEIELKDNKAFEKKTGEEVKILPAEKISKSKNNGDSPDSLVEKYGADTLRLYMMFTAPPERDLEWSEAAIEGAWRYLNRVWQLVEDVKTLETEPLPSFATMENRKERDALRKVHQTIRKVTADVEKFQYNTMVAACMELTNTLVPLKNEGVEGSIKVLGTQALVQLLNPACPHITEELWESLGNTTPLHASQWPTFDADIAKDEEITLVVQVNGKVRAKFLAPAEIAKDEAITQAKDAIAEHIAGLTIRKEIYVPGRLVNVVAN